MNKLVGPAPTIMARPQPRSTTSDRPRGPWKHGALPVLGLVGGIGAGKSQVAAELARRGALVIDADNVGHALLDQRPARDLAVRRFGESILDRSTASALPPHVDRKAL